MLWIFLWFILLKFLFLIFCLILSVSSCIKQNLYWTLYFNLIFCLIQIKTSLYMLIFMLTIYPRIHHATPHPPRKISNFWLEFEKYEQYMCSKNQINKMTRLFKTLPQRKKTRSLSKAMSIPISPLVPLIWNSPLHFPSHSLIRI